MKIYTRCNGIIGDIVTYDVIQICFFNMNFDINSVETSLEIFFFFNLQLFYDKDRKKFSLFRK